MFPQECADLSVKKFLMYYEKISVSRDGTNCYILTLFFTWPGLNQFSF